MAKTDGIEWHVVEGGQRLTTQISQAGTGFVDVWEVPYRIDSGPAAGTEGVVRVPVAQYNKETVLATISAIVKHNHEVAGL